MTHDARAGVDRFGGGAIDRSVVDDEHFVDHRAAAAHDAADRPLRIERRNDDEDALAHAGSFDTTAQTMPPPAEMELTRTWLTVDG